jgi:hypothetical protein
MRRNTGPSDGESAKAMGKVPTLGQRLLESPFSDLNRRPALYESASDDPVIHVKAENKVLRESGSRRQDPNPTTAVQSTGSEDAVEGALAEALKGATAAGKWDVVAKLAGELEARRRARAEVPSLAERRAKLERQR